MHSYFPVMAGGALGAALRFQLGRWLPLTLGPGFPTATLAVNLVGGFLMGLVAGWFARSGANEAWRLFAAVGVLGGFTTFSAFSLESVLMIERGQHGLFAAYALLSVLGSVAALMAGLMLMRMWG